MNTYTIQAATGAVPLAGEVDGTPWAAADVFGIENYPWYGGGKKQATAGRMLYDAEAMYLQFVCEDRHISAEPRELHGAVCLDSCVEAFLAPHPDDRIDYFNLEVNCCRRLHMGFGAGRPERSLMDESLVDRLTIATPFGEPTKDEADDDNGWWMAAKLPFEVIGAFVGREVAPTSGSLWKGNFYRCGGKTDDQYACWNHIAWETPDFHRPEFFGELRFA